MALTPATRPWLAALLLGAGLAGVPRAHAEPAEANGAVSAGPVDAFPPAPTLEERLGEIRRRVQAAVVYPTVARHSGWTGVTRVQFQIGGDGRARDILVVGTSGHGVLDQAAERGVIDAGILPRVYGKLEIPVRFALEDAR